MNAPMPHAPDEVADLIGRAAWLYYEQGLTQARIARAMAVSRGRVIEWLAAARDAGIVSVRIAGTSRGQVACQDALQSRYGIARAIVVPAAAVKGMTAALVGHALGAFLGEALQDGTSLGVGWGATLHMSLKAIERTPHARMSVVSLLGATTHSRALTPPAVARRMADAFGAECYQLTAPLVVSSAKMAKSLWAEPGLRDLRRRARQVDLALVSVGPLAADATLFASGLVPRAEIASLRAAGAVGDILGQFVDAAGQPVRHPLNHRVMAVSLADLGAVRQVVLASGGRDKAVVLRAALRALTVATLITDEAAARGLLDA